METIITDHKWKNFKYGYELPAKAKKDFDWMDQDEIDSSAFIYYRKSWYALSEFMRLEGNKQWDAYHSDTFFSAIYIKISNDCEQYQIALALS